MNQQLFFDSQTEGMQQLFVIACNADGVIDWFSGNLSLFHDDNQVIIGKKITDLPIFNSLSKLLPNKSVESLPHVIKIQGQFYNVLFVDNPSQPSSFLICGSTNKTSTAPHFFQVVLDSFPFLIWGKDCNSNYLFCNNKFAAVTKQKRTKEVIGKTDFDCFDNELAEKYRKDDKTVLSKLDHLHLEEKCFDETGNESWVETWKAPILINNNVVGTVGIARDITSNIQEKLDIEEAYNFFAQVIDAIADPVFVKNRQHEFVLVNKALADFHGKEKDEFIGKTDYDFSPRKEVDVFWHYDEVVFETGETNVNEEQATDALGQVKFISTKKTLVNQDTLVGVVRDITEATSLNNKLKQSELEFRSLAENSPDYIARWDTDANYLYINPKIERFIGSTSEQMKGEPIPDILPDLIKGVRQTIATQQPYKIQKMHVGFFEGLEQFHDVSLVPEFNETGELIGVLGIGRDVTDMYVLNDLLKKREYQFRSLSENSPDYITRWSTDYRILYFNPNIEKLFGIALSDKVNKPIENNIPQIKSCLQHVVVTKQAKTISKVKINAADGRIYFHDINLVPEFGDTNQLVSILGIGRDMTDMYQLQDKLLFQEQSFRRLAENMPDIIIRYDSSLRRIYINSTSAYQNKSNHQQGSPIELGEKPSENWVCTPNIEDAFEYESQIQKVIDSNQINIWQQKFDLKLSGRFRDYECRAVPELDNGNAVESVLVVVRDVTEQLEFERQLEYMANHDVLTDLPNRRLFEQTVNRLIENKDIYFALIYIDLDNFKPINDEFGHDVGDSVLKIVSARLANSINKGDICARLGGDEFGLAIQFDSFEQEVLAKVERLLGLLSSPIVLGRHDVRLSASMGIAIQPDSNAESEEQLLRFADKAMYDAKEQGRNRYCIFDVDTHTRNELNNELLNELSHALNLHQITVFYQPIVDAVTQKVVKAEALVRWMHPDKGVISPAEFIPVAETSGLIIELGQQVFKKAAQFAKYINQFDYFHQLEVPFKVSINISAKELSNQLVLHQWLDYLSINDIPGSYITIELTESLLINDNPQVIAQLAMLQQHGVTISLDDFGTGYSALSYLKKFNIDYLKIDRSFVNEITEDEHDRAIVEAVTLLTKRLDIKLLAEGVEQQSQLEVLQNIGCELIQGYLYSKPLPEKEFINWLKDKTACC